MRRPLRSYLLTVSLVVGDALAMWLAWAGIWALRKWADRWFPNPINDYDPFYKDALPPFLLAWWAILLRFGHYAHHRRMSSLNDLRRVLQASVILFLAMPAMAWFLKEFSLGRSVILATWGVLTIYLYASRTALRMAKRALIRRGVDLTRVVIFGTGRTALDVAESIRDHPEVGYQLIGFVNGGDWAPGQTIAGVSVLGQRPDLVRIAHETRADEVFLAAPELPKDDLLNMVVELEEARVTVKTVANLMEVITGEFQDEELADFPVMNLRDGHLPPTRAFLKRAMDLTAVAVFFPLWGLAWLAIAAYLKLTQGGPVHFVHGRVGKDGKLFRLYKFRTMRPKVDPQAPAPVDSSDPRVTPAGRWLRRTSLDELPQILNVLRGEMSLVGPRPEMPFIVEQYEEWQRRRLDVPPGLTGLWQVVGRKNLPLRYNLEYDFYYIRNQSLWLDLTILIKTIPAVLFGKGAF
ncbi:MAG: sugar transferase [Candidatus Sumerlaeota bacterium]|nr:sugar transferase [Candidatus Sumerlaeota bacterium]